MAVSWTPFPDQISLGTLRTSINNFNTSISANIGTIETNISALSTDKINIADTGIIFSNGSSSILGQAITTSYSKVKMVDTTIINHTNGHITPSYGTNTITINTTGIYKIHFSGSMLAANASLITFNYNVNGLSLIANPPQFVGRGATSPVSIENSFIISLTAGSILYIEAKADAGVTMTPVGCGISIEKSHY